MLLGAVLLIPLALPVAGIVRSQRRTFAWGTLCVTPYFIYGCMELVANPELRALATAILLASLGLAATLIAYLRLTRPVTGGSGTLIRAAGATPAPHAGTES